MAELKEIRPGGRLLYSLIDGAVAEDGKSVRAYCDFTRYRQAFGDADLVNTCFNLFANDLNVSRTAKRLYMHRNTLLYRINKLKKMTGLDVRTFGDAVDFIILYRTYVKETKNERK